MPNNSVEVYQETNPEEAMSYDDFYNDYMNTTHPDWNGRYPKYGTVSYYIAKAFSRDQKNAESKYQTYLDNLALRNEYNATQSARSYEKYMSDTQVQRAMKDYEAAGLNPYLLVNAGSVGSTSYGGTSIKSSYDRHREKKEEKSNKQAGLLILGLLNLMARLL